MPKIDSDPSLRSPRAVGYESEQSGVIIDQLTAIFRVRGRYGGDTLFVGWTEDGRPAVTNNPSGLSADAQNVYTVYRRGAIGYSIPQIEYSKLTPAAYSFNRNLLDSEGQAEDFIVVSLTTSTGQTKDARIGELEILDAIVAAQKSLLDTSGTATQSGDRIVTAESLYTVVVPSYDLPEDTAYALLFKPAMENAPQMYTFRAFAVDTVLKILMNDERQDGPNKRGYFKAAYKYLGQHIIGKAPGWTKIFFASDQAGAEFAKALHNVFFTDEHVSDRTGSSNLITPDFFKDLEMRDIFAVARDLSDIGHDYFRTHR